MEAIREFLDAMADEVREYIERAELAEALEDVRRGISIIYDMIGKHNAIMEALEDIDMELDYIIRNEWCLDADVLGEDLMDVYTILDGLVYIEI